MLLVYFSRTSNIERFVEHLKLNNVQRIDVSQNFNNLPIIEQPFWLITYTDMLGEVPAIVDAFLSLNYNQLRAVSASGNRNFGEMFAASADLISKKYNVPIILKFELSGSNKDREAFKSQFLANGGF